MVSCPPTPLSSPSPPLRALPRRLGSLVPSKRDSTKVFLILGPNAFRPQNPKPPEPKHESGGLVFCPERCPSVQRAAQPSGTEHPPIQIIALGVVPPRAKAVKLHSTLWGVQEEGYLTPKVIKSYEKRNPFQGFVVFGHPHRTKT